VDRQAGAQSLIEQKWSIRLGLGRISQLFHQFGLAHQRAHRDYGPSSPAERSAFIRRAAMKAAVAGLLAETAENPAWSDLNDALQRGAGGHRQGRHESIAGTGSIDRSSGRKSVAVASGFQLSSSLPSDASSRHAQPFQALPYTTV
jgi:hypothetical protein